MSMQVDEKYETKIREIAESTGRSVTAVLEEVLARGLSQVPDSTDDCDVNVWKPQLMQFLDEINSLPVEGPDDGFSGADHDEVLYPRHPQSL